MCLSTVYRDRVEPENMLMKNVQTIEYDGKEIILTDLLDRTMTFSGELVKASLTEGIAIVREK